MKLYRCKTPTNRACACGKVARELESAGIEFETERVPLSTRPEKRQNIMALTGQARVPVLVDDLGQATSESERIIELIRARPDTRA